MYVSEYLAKKGNKVILSERESDFMQRASYNNQARVHNGCHYPRSVLTALRSKISFSKFISEFEDCIDHSFEKYYMISRVLSKVSAGQFMNFCHRIGIKCNEASGKITALANPYYIEKIFSVKEFAFNSKEIKKILYRRIQNAGVECYLNNNIQSVKKQGKKLMAHTDTPKGKEDIGDLDMAFNCTYSMTNKVISNSKLEFIPLKHEMTEMSLVEVPEELKNVGITVVDGPFFSVMPFPAQGLHSFSHVRYTPHYEWHDEIGKSYKDQSYKATKKSLWKYVLKDAERYIPVLSKCRYSGPIWEVKTVLPLSEYNDSRPILFRPHCGLKGFHTIVGSKIDNVYDIIEVIENMGILDG